MIIAFSNYKGGTGKTTSCISVAGCLAKKGKKVLVVDLDPQGNATSGLGIDKKTLKSDIYDVLSKGKSIKKVILDTGLDNLHLAPANQDLENLYLVADDEKPSVDILKESLKKVGKYYDYILIDTPPLYKHLIANGIVAADKTLVVLDPGIFALESLSGLNESFGGFFKGFGLNFNIYMVLITRCKKLTLPWKKKHSKEIKEEVENSLNKAVFTVPSSDHIYNTHAKGVPISHFKPRSDVGRAYEKITNRILENDTNNKK